MLGIKNKTVEVGIKITFVGIAFAAVHLSAGRWVFKQINDGKAVYENAKVQLDERESMVRKYPNPKKEIEMLKADMENLKKKAVPENEIPKILEQLSRKTSELNIEVVSINPLQELPFEPEPLPQGVSKAYIQVVLNVEYKKLAEYLKALSESTTVFTIEGVTLEKIEDAKNIAVRGAKPVESRAEPKAKEKKEEEGGKILATLLISSYTVWQQ